MRTRRPYPTHAYPEIIPTYSYIGIKAETILNPSKKTKIIINSIKKGARVLFDMRKGRGFIYKFEAGIQIIMELTTRTLSQLIKSGHLIMAQKDGETVHFISPSNLSY